MKKITWCLTFIDLLLNVTMIVSIVQQNLPCKIYITNLIQQIETQFHSSLLWSYYFYDMIDKLKGKTYMRMLLHLYE